MFARRLRFPDPPHPSDRYTSAVTCANRSFLFSRRLVDANGVAANAEVPVQEFGRKNEWVTVVRQQAEDRLSYGNATTSLPVRLRLSHNAVIACDDGVEPSQLLVLGGRYRPNRTGFEREVGIRRATACPTRWPLNWSEARPLWPKPAPPTGQGCNNRLRDGECEFDGRLAFVREQHRHFLFARANMHREGGARHVQVTSSVDGLPGTWSSWQLLNISNVADSEKTTNIYFVVVAPLGVLTGNASAPGLVGLYPAALPGRAGIFVSLSLNGVQWTSPRLLLAAAKVVEHRTSDYPVSGTPQAESDRITVHVEHGMSSTHENKSLPSDCVYSFAAAGVRRAIARDPELAPFAW